MHQKISQMLAKGIFLLGPTGMFFTPIPALGSLRVFYFLCLLFVFNSLAGFSRNIFLRLCLLITLVCIFFFSASYGVIALRPEMDSLAQNPLIRASVISILLISFFFVAKNISKNGLPDRLNRYLELSFIGFCLVFFLGGLIYIFSLLGVIPKNIYGYFVSLEQSGYGYLRFSPGTYPNEFGILCSFYALFSFLQYGRFKKFRYAALGVIFVGGILLTTTRTAYITFLVGYFMLIALFPNPRVRFNYLAVSILSVPMIIYLLNIFSFNVVGVIRVGYEAMINQKGSVAIRQESWHQAMDSFLNSYVFGAGFESPDVSFLHNLPLQVLYGLGIVGLAIVFVVALIFWFLQSSDRRFVIAFPSIYEKRCAVLLRLVLLEHVFLFGLTNHNQTHFLTWLLFAILCLKFRVSTQDRVGTKSYENAAVSDTSCTTCSSRAIRGRRSWSFFRL